MKQILLILFIIYSSSGFGQNIKHRRVPPEVLINFSSIYPDAKDVVWSRQGKLYIAEFTDNQVSTSVLFDKIGKLQQVINYIQKKDLPKEAQDYLYKYYKQKPLGEISKVKDAKGVVTFIVEIKKEALVFDVKGKYLRVQK